VREEEGGKADDWEAEGEHGGETKEREKALDSR